MEWVIYFVKRNFLWKFIGLILIVIQKVFGLVKLDPSIYILIKFRLIDFNILFVNFGIILVCISLVIPHLLFRISPSKVIRIQ